MTLADNTPVLADSSLNLEATSLILFPISSCCCFRSLITTTVYASIQRQLEAFEGHHYIEILHS